MDDRQRTKDDGRRVPSDGKSSHCLWQGGLTSHWVDMLLHTDTLFRFRANQSLLFLFNAAFLAEKQQIPILYSFVLQDRSSYSQSIALEASTLTITLPMRFPIFILFLLLF
jgi:hypothetical protein